MVVIRCTQKLLKRVAALRNPKGPATDPKSTTRLGDWFAAPLSVGRQRFILLVAEHTRLPVIVPERDVKRLREHLVDALQPLLRGLGVPDAAIEPELAEMHDAAFAPTNSRSIVGTLVEFARMAEHPLQDANADLTAASLWLARTPILTLNSFADDLTRARLSAPSAAPAVPSAVRTYRLKVTLLDIAPPIWRRFEVPADISLDQLHTVLQIVIGWTNSHLHAFEKDGTTYGMRHPEFGPDFVDERLTRLSDVLPDVGASLAYEYDFGDGWQHRLVLEAASDAIIPAARVLDGRRACPPEDVGGIGGYELFLEAIANPKHRDHKQMMGWSGGRFDAEAFDVASLNARLGGVRLRPGARGPVTQSRLVH